jgi:predicted nucleic acid-binding protein
LIHLDAGVVIGFLDGNDAHHHAARTVLANALRDGDRLAMASPALAECLVGPARRGDSAIETVRDLVERFPITVVPLDVELAIVAARLRATHSALRLPDALVIATASADGADQLVTTDRKWPTARSLKLKAVLTRL